MARKRNTAIEDAPVAEEQGEVTESAEVEVEPEKPGLVKIIASSMSYPGHRRAGHFWPAGKLASAMLTPEQAKQVRSDPRITVFDPDAEIPSTQDVQQSLEKSIRDEMNRIAEERRRQEAVDNMRRRTEPVAGVRDFRDRR